MSSLYSFNNIGYGTSRYQLGLDGTQIPEQKKEAGFFSGMAMSLSDIAIFLINPFVLMMKPAVASTASIDMKVLILGFVETIIFFMVGWYLGKIKHYE